MRQRAPECTGEGEPSVKVNALGRGGWGGHVGGGNGGGGVVMGVEAVDNRKGDTERQRKRNGDRGNTTARYPLTVEHVGKSALRDQKRTSASTKSPLENLKWLKRARPALDRMSSRLSPSCVPPSHVLLHLTPTRPTLLPRCPPSVARPARSAAWDFHQEHVSPASTHPNRQTSKSRRPRWFVMTSNTTSGRTILWRDSLLAAWQRKTRRCTLHFHSLRL